MPQPWVKGLREVLDYEVLMAKALNGDTIMDAKVVAGSEVEVSRVSFDSSNVTFWLKGGRAPTMTEVVCTVATHLGRTFTERVPLQLVA